MKNMKRLISIIAVLAMMLSMVTIASAATITADETFNMAVSTHEIEEGSTDTFNVRITFTVESEANAAKGVSNIALTLNFDPTVITVEDSHAWTVSDDLDPAKQKFGSTATNDGSQGVLRLAYAVTATEGTITTGSYFDVPVKLAEGAKAGDSTTLSLVGTSAMVSWTNLEKGNMNWIAKADVANYATPGSVTVTGGAPVLPTIAAGESDSSFGNADATTNYSLTWGNIGNVDSLTSAYTYGIVAYTGEGDFDATTAGAVLYPAKGNLDGAFGVKLLGNLVPENIRTKVYLYDGTTYTYGE